MCQQFTDAPAYCLVRLVHILSLECYMSNEQTINHECYALFYFLKKVVNDTANQNKLQNKLNHMLEIIGKVS